MRRSLPLVLIAVLLPGCSPDRIQLLALDAPEGGGLSLAWPLDVAPYDFAETGGLGLCHVVTGSEVPAAMEKLAAGTLRTTWEHEGVRWSLWGRHLLEGEAGCEASQG